MKMYRCSYPNCSELLQASGYCARHIKYKPKPFANAVRSNEALYRTQQWKQLRHDVIDRHPFCSLCGTNTALTVHHIRTPRGNPDLFFNENNLQVICVSCHRYITAQEIRQRKLNR